MSYYKRTSSQYGKSSLKGQGYNLWSADQGESSSVALCNWVAEKAVNWHQYLKKHTSKREKYAPFHLARSVSTLSLSARIVTLACSDNVSYMYNQCHRLLQQ